MLNSKVLIIYEKQKFIKSIYAKNIKIRLNKNKLQMIKKQIIK